MGTKLSRIALAVAMLVLARMGFAGEVESREIHTEHYDLYIEGPGADELAGLVEPLYARLKEFFGKEPEGRLRVKVFANRESFNDGTDRDGVQSPGRSFYCSSNRTCYVLRLDGERHTILHECTHQFHFLAATGNHSPKSVIYTEGVAEHFAEHRWTGGRAVLETVPQIDDYDVGSLAIDSFMNRHSGSIVQLATDDDQNDTSDNYGGGWGLVSFLYERHREIFGPWSGALDEGATPEAAWKLAAKGVDESKLSDEFGHWLHDVEAPWHAITGYWTSPNLKLIEAQGEAGLFATAYFKQPVRSLSTTVEIQGTAENVSAGLVVGLEDNDTYYLVDVLSDGGVRVRARAKGKWILNWSVEGARVRDPRNFSIRAEIQERVASIFIDDGAITHLPIAQDGRMGLFAANGSVRFAPTAQ